MIILSHYEWQQAAKWKFKVGYRLDNLFSPALLRFDKFCRRVLAAPWKRRSVHIPCGGTGKMTFWANDFDITIPDVPWEAVSTIMANTKAWRNWAGEALWDVMNSDLGSLFYDSGSPRNLKLRVSFSNGQAHFVWDMTWRINSKGLSKLNNEKALACAVFVPEVREKKEIVKGLSVGDVIHEKKDLKKILGKIYPYISGSIEFIANLIRRNPASHTIGYPPVMPGFPPLLGVFWPNPFGAGYQRVLCEMTYRGVNILEYGIVEKEFTDWYFDPVGTAGGHPSASVVVPVKTILSAIKRHSAR
jgi:hypothetical protein